MQYCIYPSVSLRKQTTNFKSKLLVRESFTSESGDIATIIIIIIADQKGFKLDKLSLESVAPDLEDAKFI